MTKKKKIILIVLLSVGGVIATAISALGGFIIYASATTLNEPGIKDIEVKGKNTKELNSEETIKMMSWNIGYASLDERMDFYLNTRNLSDLWYQLNLKGFSRT